MSTKVEATIEDLYTVEGKATICFRHKKAHKTPWLGRFSCVFCASLWRSGLFDFLHGSQS